MAVQGISKVLVVWLAVVASVFFHQTGIAAALSFSADGKKITTMTADDLARKLPLVQMQVKNPENGKLFTYEGYRFADVLKMVFGTDWPRYQTIEFGCADGYQPEMKASIASRH